MKKKKNSPLCVLKNSLLQRTAFPQYDVSKTHICPPLFTRPNIDPQNSHSLPHKWLAELLFPNKFWLSFSKKLNQKLFLQGPKL